MKLAASYEHPAVFACIMRREGGSSTAQQKLDCHGFVCQSKEDAVLVASNLYKSLMHTMRQEESPVMRGNKIANPTPQRPPRQRRKRSSAQKRSSEDSSAEENVMMADENLGKVKRSYSEKFLDEIPGGKEKRQHRERRSYDDSDVATLRGAKGIMRDSGDIYTKVAMPRSKSFMSVGGPYNNLQELFGELREKEGIESVDDILRQVVSPEGMSYNQTSPVYRELLLKLAMSMSADEMFIRSKNIMMQEKLKKGFNFPHFPKNDSAAAKPSGFGKVLQIFGVAKKGNKLSSSQNRVSKADIGDPMPLSDETKKELTRQWMKSSPHLNFDSLANPLAFRQGEANRSSVIDLTRKKSANFGVAAAVQKKRNNNNNSNSTVNNVNNNLTTTDGGESYMSCSECGYQSVCGTNCCSCSVFATTTAAEDEEDEMASRQKDKK